MTGSLVLVNQTLAGSAIENRLALLESGAGSLEILGVTGLDHLLNEGTHLGTGSDITLTGLFRSENTLLGRLNVGQTKHLLR